MKKLSVVFLALTFILFSCSKENIAPERVQTHYIKGKIVGYDAKPMEMADVQAVIYADQLQELSVEVDDKGNFTIPFKNADFIKLSFTGVGHSRSELEFMNNRAQKDIDLIVQLKPNIAADNFDKLSVIGTFNNFSFNNGAIPMIKEDDGNYYADVPNDGDTLYYQLLGACQTERSINGTMAHGYIYDGGGDYRSYLVTSDTSVRITFDPYKLPYGDFEETFLTRNEDLKQYLKLKESIETYYAKAFEKYKKTKKYEDYFKYVYDKVKKRLAKDDLTENNKLYLTSNLIKLAYQIGEELDKDMVKLYLQSFSPLSAYWAKDASLLLPALEVLGNETYKENYLNNLINKNPTNEVKEKILYNLVEFYAEKQDKDSQMKYYNILMDKYPDSKLAKNAKKMYSPDKKVQTGKPLPEFSLDNLEKDGEKITNETLKGKYWLVDLWATWCGPCVGEMGNLHKAYQKFHGKNFDMLSISLDRKKDDIAKFRKGKWKMPWLHSFSEGVWESKVVELFECRGIPQPMLIDPNGVLVEIDGNLRGEQLEETLKKYLK